MTLRSRLAAGLVIIAIILVGPLVFAIQSLHGLHDDAVELRDQDFGASLLIGSLREGLNDLRREELALLFAKNEQARNTMEREVGHVGALADSLSHYQLPRYAKDIAGSVHQISIAAPTEYDAALRSDTTFADSISEHVFVPALNHADSVVAAAERDIRARTQTRVQEQEQRIAGTTTVSGAALFIALSIAAVIAFWLTRSISGPILDLRAGMSAVADGDLSYRLGIPAERSDEFGRLAESFQEMTRQLGELDKLKAEFVSVASHELKTPINVMIGYLQLLDEGVYGPLNPKQKEVHKTLVVQANTLLRLVKQLLDVSRFEAGGGRLEPREVHISSLVGELESTFHVLAVQREIAFRIDQRNGLPNTVYWDLDRVNEVLGNLLSNAFKFTPHGGSVMLVLEPVDHGVKMQVRDTGAGIPPQQLPRIFDKFYQADNQRSAHGMGTGLGLAIAKQIVDAHGGAISCESTPGKGTTFTITLPIRVVRRSSMQRGVSAI
ncbi:MAG TPA: HAMP domain-containing sensor histidine kinase [Gemmatimonadaceae bacterium]